MNDSHLQQMLLATEAAPPGTVWENIAVELDAQDEDKPIQQQLLFAEETPPAAVWLQIEPALNDHTFQKTLAAAEEEAPAFVWEQLEQQLNNQTFDEKVSAILHTTEENAPATAWASIEQSLEEKQAPVIPISRNNKRFYQVAIAAAFIGVMAWGGYRLINNNQQSLPAEIIASASTAEEHATAPATKPADSNLVIAEEEPEATTTNRRIQIKERIKQKLASPDALAYAETPDHNLQNSVAYQGIHHQQTEVPQQTNGFSESQYFLVLNDNGELVRVSKKIGNLKCAVGAGTPVDAASALQSKDCNEQIKRWREKMAMAAAISASAGDIDLNQLINSTDQQ
ncbi:MAG: hypothetical protein GXC73_10910 [Chitinophagaceae bacterium]|nr:hypothetical protein [Chitinophagaceae bacterium]